MMSDISVMVVDDNAILRMGLTNAIDSAEGFSIVGEAANAEKALRLYKDLLPDVVTMDYNLPDFDGVQCTEKIMAFNPGANIILLTINEAEEEVWQAVEAGCKGYLLKRAGQVEDVLHALSEVASGGTYFPANVAKKIQQRLNHEMLTPRELDVLRCLGEGSSNKEIMDTLQLSESTVKMHLSNIRKKLNAADRTQALIEAVKRGLIHIEE
ncbi:MAG: DNA-binding response regulator [Kiritimatiellaceae bacterium]|nr:DNA-binding response regulator [Kiritimatiellaceae bacterium]MAW39346.1 DNA-binding response regulator [Kiritimatiellaceae bacterium]RZO87350.1 MAG: response regulator transcription factor [Kiritimatiellaceae bacterium]